jgi:hypothetical protein
LSTSILQLFQNHAFFFFDIFLLEQWIAHQVRTPRRTPAEMLIQHLDVVADQLFRSERIQPATDRIHRSRNLFSGPFLVPLNTMCSMKWEMPATSGVSSREPVPIQTPTETLRTCGICSVTTRTPFGQRGALDVAHLGVLMRRILW